MNSTVECNNAQYFQLHRWRSDSTREREVNDLEEKSGRALKTFSENFENIFFTESKFGELDLVGNVLRIPVSGLFVLMKHPLILSGDGPYEGWLVFEGVSSSSRTVTEYIGGPMAPGGFAEPYHKEEGPFPAALETQNEYAFEGRQLKPFAWIDNWVVKAKSFRFVLKDI